MTYMYEGTKFGDLEVGTKFKQYKSSFVIYTKVKPSMKPRQHNATSNGSNAFHWFDQEEEVFAHDTD